MDAAVGSYERREGIDVRKEQLGEFSIFHDLVDDRMKVAKLLEFALARRTRAALGLLHREVVTSRVVIPFSVGQQLFHFLDLRQKLRPDRAIEISGCLQLNQKIFRVVAVRVITRP